MYSFFASRLHVSFFFKKNKLLDQCGAARPTGARHAGSDGLKRLVGAAMNADTRPGARLRTPLAAAMLFPSSWPRPPIPAGRHGLNQCSTYTDTMGSLNRAGCTVFGLRRRRLRFEPPSVAAPWGPCTKVTAVWLPCPGTKEATSKNSRREQPQPSREPPRRGFMLRACLCL
jgi:hypothetical protein